MATTDDTSGVSPGKPEQLLEQLIKAQRTKLLQAHAIMICLGEALLYAEGDDDTVIYAEAANAAALLTIDAAEEADSVRLQPVFMALRLERACRLVQRQRLPPTADDDRSASEMASPLHVC
jgi:hypothetical protein